MTTIIDVSTEAQLDAAIAEVDADTTSGDSYQIVLTASISETYVLLNAINLHSGVMLSISDGPNTLVGPYALAPAVTINSGSTLTAAGTVPAGEIIGFAGTGTTNAVLDIGTLSAFAGTLEGFASGDVLAVSSTITAATPGTYNSATNTTALTLTNGTSTIATLSLLGDYSAASFNLSGDNVTVVLPSVSTTLSSGSMLSKTQEIANGATTAQTGQVTFGIGSDPATVINQGTFDITGAWGITQAAAGSLFINDGTLERDANGVSGVSGIYVDVIDTGVLDVPDNDPAVSDTNLRFFGAHNSFSGTYVGGGMIDYGTGSTNYLGNIDMSLNACTTNFSIVNQNGVVMLSSGSTITNIGAATWNFTSDNGVVMENPSRPSSAAFTNYGTVAKTGGTGTTVIGVDFDPGGGGGSINVASGTIAFDGPSNIFTTTISGIGTFSLGGGGTDAINSGTTINTSGWIITDADVTLNTTLSYTGTFTEQSGSTLTLNDSLTLSNATVAGTVTGSSTAQIIVASGGRLAVLSGGVASPTTILSGSTEIISSGAVANGSIAFGGTGGTLRFDTTTSGTITSAMISGFTPGDTIDLSAVGFDINGSITLLANNVLEIKENGHTYDLDFNISQNFAGWDFRLSTDSATGTNIRLGGQRDDFNLDRTSDILFRKDATGDTWFAQMSNSSFVSWHQIGGSNTSYAAVGVGDFYVTGTSDVLLRNNSTGDTWFEAISNGAFAGWQQIGGSNTTYSVVGVADFYGDSIDDILFRNSSTGDTWIEAMSNGAFAGWHQIGGSNTNYAVVGVGDFYGNGTSDILFRNNSTGDTWIEAISNGAFNGWHQIGGSDTHYSVAGIGDFDGNGVSDILFRNNSSGDTWYEAISNASFNGWHQIGSSDTTYAVVGVGDYSASGTDDILFRKNSTGDTWFADMSNGVFAGWHQIGGSDPGYTVKT
jgi:autotransporter passenger strand-loop-strand repeat protein